MPPDRGQMPVLMGPEVVNQVLPQQSRKKKVTQVNLFIIIPILVYLNLITFKVKPIF